MSSKGPVSETEVATTVGIGGQPPDQHRRGVPAPSAGRSASPTRRDPAERRRSLRIFYSRWRPTRLGKLVDRFTAWLSGLGLTPPILLTLQVKGRTSSRLRSNVLVPATYNGQRYVVSMLGDRSEWVRNVRAAGGEAFIKRGRARPVWLTEIPPAERAPILKAYCEVATSGRHHFPVPPSASLAEFEAIAAYYPVFRIDPPTH
jgi:F420H(2)-dependent quinone reductase